MNINSDFGALTKEAREISDKSLAIVQKEIKGTGPEDCIRQRCAMATGDIGFAGLLRFTHDPVNAGIKAIRDDSPIYTDVRMAKAGITGTGHRCKVACVLDEGGDIANRDGITRTSAGFIFLGQKLKGSIVVIGNAPSAALSVCNLVKQGIRPSIIIATPVGFVNAAESKELVRTLDIPSITCVGTRGGTPVAVAIVNELVRLSNI